MAYTINGVLGRPENQATSSSKARLSWGENSLIGNVLSGSYREDIERQLEAERRRVAELNKPKVQNRQYGVSTPNRYGQNFQYSQKLADQQAASPYVTTPTKQYAKVPQAARELLNDYLIRIDDEYLYPNEKKRRTAEDLVKKQEWDSMTTKEKMKAWPADLPFYADRLEEMRHLVSDIESGTPNGILTGLRDFLIRANEKDSAELAKIQKKINAGEQLSKTEQVILAHNELRQVYAQEVPKTDAYSVASGVASTLWFGLQTALAGMASGGLGFVDKAAKVVSLAPVAIQSVDEAYNSYFDRTALKNSQLVENEQGSYELDLGTDTTTTGEKLQVAATEAAFAGFMTWAEDKGGEVATSWLSKGLNKIPLVKKASSTLGKVALLQSLAQYGKTKVPNIAFQGFVEENLEELEQYVAESLLRRGGEDLLPSGKEALLTMAVIGITGGVASAPNMIGNANANAKLKREFTQTLVAGGVNKQTADRIFDVLTTSSANGANTSGNAYSIDQRVLNDFHAQAEENNLGFQEQMKNIADSLKLEYLEGPVKSIERISQKAGSDYRDDVSQVKDAVRGTYLISDPAEIESIISRIGESVPVEYNPNKNSFLNDNPGYKDAKIYVDRGNGLKAEIILTTPEMQKTKDGFGHKLYEVQRRLDKTDPNLVNINNELNELSNKLYSQALLESSQRLEGSRASLGTRPGQSSSQSFSPSSAVTRRPSLTVLSGAARAPLSKNLASTNLGPTSTLTGASSKSKKYTPGSSNNPNGDLYSYPISNHSKLSSESISQKTKTTNLEKHHNSTTKNEKIKSLRQKAKQYNDIDNTVVKEALNNAIEEAQIEQEKLDARQTQIEAMSDFDTELSVLARMYSLYKGNDEKINKAYATSRKKHPSFSGLDEITQAYNEAFNTKLVSGSGDSFEVFSQIKSFQDIDQDLLKKLQTVMPLINSGRINLEKAYFPENLTIKQINALEWLLDQDDLLFQKVGYKGKTKTSQSRYSKARGGQFYVVQSRDVSKWQKAARNNEEMQRDMMSWLNKPELMPKGASTGEIVEALNTTITNPELLSELEFAVAKAYDTTRQEAKNLASMAEVDFDNPHSVIGRLYQMQAEHAASLEGIDIEKLEQAQHKKFQERLQLEQSKVSLSKIIAFVEKMRC